MQTSQPGQHRLPLTKDAIVDASLRVVESEGIASLSMRRVADELGVAPMSLYRHVGDRRDLLIAMLDVVALAIERPGSGEPRAELREILAGLHSAFQRHDWVVQLLTVDGLASVHIMPLMNQIFDALARSGLQPEAALKAWQLLFEYLIGESMMTHTRGTTQAQEVFRATDPDELPALAPLKSFKGRRKVQDDFEANLDLLLDALLP
ncbi:helix-turn-helix domain-containing protein [Brooklawnia sp.]|uniref:TetR/AcrR family transcriptional regulator n=1 Tax=Brooklawnia sp. TaxID=2699740 RepID=UPI00311DEED9